MKTNFFDAEVEAILKIEDSQQKFERFFSLIFIYIDGQHADVVISLLKKFIEEAEKKSDLGYDAVFYYSLAYINLSLGKKDLFKEYQSKAKERFDKIITPAGKAFFYTYESIVCWFEGKRNDGFDCIFKGIKAVEGSRFSEVIGWCYFTLATYQFDTNLLTDAEANYAKALSYFKIIDSKYGYARANNGIASIKIKQEKLVEAAEILNEIRDIYVYYGKLSGLSRALTDLGVIESKLGHLKEALQLHESAYKMRLETSNIQGQLTSLLEMGEVLLKMKLPADAENYLLNAAAISGKNNFKAKAYRAHELLAQVYKETGEFEKAMHHLQDYFDFKIQVLADESTSRLKLLETQVHAEEASKRAELEQQKNIELQKAYNIIEEKNTEILQSIDYAKRIQKSILPDVKVLKELFQDIFILYYPKDIVAGDFYWMSKQKHKLFFAVCDSMGHGVPGAFVSLVCNQALNRAVLEFNLTHPAEILDKVNEIVIEAFSGNEQEQINDGMDASLLVIDFEKEMIEWAGANNPLWIVDKKGGSTELKEYKGDKQPIGRFDHVQPFTNHQIPLVKGNHYYLFSDGYADQFGGPNWESGGKKFSQKRFRELVLSQAAFSIGEQEAQFEKSFLDWKKSSEQIDDILVAGFTL